jgi:phosphoglycolate phosphatase
MLCVPTAMAFDLDGTLVDSVADLAASVNHTRSHFGLDDLPLDIVRTYVGDGAAKLLRRSLSTLGDALEPVFEEAVATFRAHYGAHCLDRTRPYPGVVETLAVLSDLPLAVVSNKPQPFCDRVVQGLGLDRHIRVVVGARPPIPVKPAPDLLRIAFDALHVDPAGAWMVGDSPNDIRGGRAAGCATIAATYGLVSMDRLATEHPDALVHRFSDLLDLRDATRTLLR